MRFRIMALAVAGTLSIALLGYTPTALADQRNCPGNRFCVWINGDFQDPMGVFSERDDDLRNNGLHDNISSLYNHTHTRWCVWSDINRHGGPLFVAVEQGYPHLGSIGWGDKIDSVGPC